MNSDYLKLFDNILMLHYFWKRNLLKTCQEMSEFNVIIRAG